MRCAGAVDYPHAPLFSVQLEAVVWRYGAFRRGPLASGVDLLCGKCTRRDRVPARARLSRRGTTRQSEVRGGCRLVLPANMVVGHRGRFVFSRVAQNAPPSIHRPRVAGGHAGRVKNTSVSQRS